MIGKSFNDCYENGGGLLWFKKNNVGHWDYSDGESVERSLYEAVASCSDPSVLSSELRERIVDWPTLYYFSPRRANLMRPFAGLLSGRRVLEIGAGCGAVSHFLADVSEELVALEPSFERAKVAAERCRLLGNVKVVVDDLESFADTGEKFDAITLIGVLEYAHRFSGREDAPVHWLRLARDMLSPGGVLFLAIENKIGLKYFAGAPEDHIGRPMFGVGDLYRSDGPRTFGLVELRSMLEKAGFSSAGTAVPLPDYKLPASVLLCPNDEVMPGFDGGAALAAASVHQDRDLAGMPLFPMDRTWKVLADNSLLMDLANSFLMVAHRDPVKEAEIFGVENERVSAFHYSVDRHPYFCKQARFVQSSAGLIVERSLLVPGSNVCDDIACVPVDEPYVPGKLWSAVLYDHLAVEGWSIDDLASWLTGWIDAIGGASPVCLPVMHGCSAWLSFDLPGDFIDFAPQNLVMGEDGGFHFIDREWRSSKNVSLGFVLFRGLYLTLAAALPVGRPAAPENLSFEEFIISMFGVLGVPRHDVQSKIPQWIALESDFQKGVRGGQGISFSDFKASSLKCSLLSSREGAAGLHFAGLDSIRSELDSLRVVHEQLNDEHERVAQWARNLNDEHERVLLWAKQLNDEHAQVSQWAKQLSEDNERVSKWAKQLSEENELVAFRLGRLTDEHEKTVAWAKSLDEEIVRICSINSDMQKDLDEKRAWAISLDEEIRRERAVIASLLEENNRVRDEKLQLELRFDRIARPFRFLRRILRGGI